MDLTFVLVHSTLVGPSTWAPVAAKLGATGAGTVQPVVLVAHSSAGLFLPVIVAAATRPVSGCLFVDAALPSRSGPTPGWDRRPCGYLLFSPAYEETARDARDRGWDVDQIPGRHLHQLVDPEAIAGRILTMAATW